MKQNNSRIDKLEKLLSCKIQKKINYGLSLEKYEAIYDNQKVLLRIFDDIYFNDRYLREGIAIRKLSKSSDPSDIIIPKIIQEWPEYGVRAIEWFDMSHNLSPNQIKSSLTWLNQQRFKFPYNLQDDLINHLSNLDQLHPSYVDFFSSHSRNILKLINWSTGDKTFLHGDFHINNLARFNDAIIIYDFEYATYGSHFYNNAQIQSSVNHDIGGNIPIEWQLLVSLTNLHWFLQEHNFSPKESLTNIELISSLSKNLY